MSTANSTSKPPAALFNLTEMQLARIQVEALDLTARYLLVEMLAAGGCYSPCALLDPTEPLASICIDSPAAADTAAASTRERGSSKMRPSTV